jgi:tetratricopeptide (TPR) repeat protein
VFSKLDICCPAYSPGSKTEAIVKVNTCCWIAALIITIVPPVHAHTVGPSPSAVPVAATVGQVAFANSGAPGAQQDFLYGLAQLHNFQYPDAAAAFQRAQQADPTFALAYWGEAMTYNHPVWMQQDAAKARAVLARLGADPAARHSRAKTEREQAYLDAVEMLYADGDKFERDRRYAQSMRRLHERWPDDVDGTAFYALALLGTAHDGRDVPTYMRSYALLEDLFRQFPQHPGVTHYLIHSVDDAAHAPLGLKAAQAYGRIAPESSHALHMTSHIYLALGLWDEVVAANEAAFDLGARRARGRGYAPGGCGHGSTWLNYGYLQQGRHEDAKRLILACLKEVRERPRYADDPDQFDLDRSSLASFYAMRLRYLLDGPADASEVAAWSPPADGVPLAAFLRDYSTALRAARQGGAVELRSAVAQLRSSAGRLTVAMDRFAVSPDNPVRRVTALQLDQLDALLSVTSGDDAGGLRKLEAVAAAEDQLPAAFGPPQVDQPTRELLGGLLLERGQPAAARVQFERALVLNPGRVTARRGLLAAARATGDLAEAESIDAALRKTLARANAGAGAGAGAGATAAR